MMSTKAKRQLENGGLIRDLLRWLAEEPKDYDDVMAAWRTSCPRLPIWEDAIDHGMVERFHDGEGRLRVRVTETGLRYIKQGD